MKEIEENHNITPLFTFEVSTEEHSDLSTWFPSDICNCIIIQVMFVKHLIEYVVCWNGMKWDAFRLTTKQSNTELYRIIVQPMSVQMISC